MTNLLIIPDPHASPAYDNERFVALGNFILETKPDIIVCLGDFADLPSLSRHKTLLESEGKRVRLDLDWTWDAMAKLTTPMDIYNIDRARHHKAQYKPRLVMILGNHDNHIVRACHEIPWLENFISVDDLPYYGWEIVPFKHSIEIGSISFSHYFTSGVMGRPIGGVNISRQMITKLHVSAVQGHSHIFSHAEDTLPNGQKIFGLSAGCYSHPDYREDWCRDTEFRWWRGVVVLKDLDGSGYYDEIQAITQRKLMREYL